MTPATVPISVPENGCLTINFPVDQQTWRTSVQLTAIAGSVPCPWTFKNCGRQGSGSLPPELGVGQIIDVDPACSITFTFGGGPSLVTLKWE